MKTVITIAITLVLSTAGLALALPFPSTDLNLDFRDAAWGGAYTDNRLGL